MGNIRIKAAQERTITTTFDTTKKNLT